MKCTEKDCPEDANVKIMGPHGVVDYCYPHAEWYEKLMETLGAPTRRIAATDSPRVIDHGHLVGAFVSIEVPKGYPRPYEAVSAYLARWLVLGATDVPLKTKLIRCEVHSCNIAADPAMVVTVPYEKTNGEGDATVLLDEELWKDVMEIDGRVIRRAAYSCGYEGETALLFVVQFDNGPAHGYVMRLADFFHPLLHRTRGDFCAGPNETH